MVLHLEHFRPLKWVVSVINEHCTIFFLIYILYIYIYQINAKFKKSESLEKFQCTSLLVWAARSRGKFTFSFVCFILVFIIGSHKTSMAWNSKNPRTYVELSFYLSLGFRGLNNALPTERGTHAAHVARVSQLSDPPAGWHSANLLVGIAVSQKRAWLFKN